MDEHPSNDSTLVYLSVIVSCCVFLSLVVIVSCYWLCSVVDFEYEKILKSTIKPLSCTNLLSCIHLFLSSLLYLDVYCYYFR